MAGYVPFHHKHLEDRENKHEIARVPLSVHKVDYSYKGFIIHISQGYRSQCNSVGVPDHDNLGYLLDGLTSTHSGAAGFEISAIEDEFVIPENEQIFLKTISLSCPFSPPSHHLFSMSGQWRVVRSTQNTATGSRETSSPVGTLTLASSS